MTTLNINVNGKTREVDVDPSTPLLWALRDNLEMTGTKFGCGMAACGACTVHVNGQATRSCVTPVSAAAGARITTIEGIGSDRVGRAVMDAWLKHDVAQCGYCQNGQVMSAIGLLRTKPRPTDADIDQAMAGNLCRCGTYQRIRAAIKTPPVRWPEREETNMRIRGIEALAGGQAGNSGEARPNTGVATLDRRSFLKLTGLAGGGLALGVAPLAQAQEGAKPKAPPPAPQAFLIIAPDNTVTVAVNRLEFGQGVHTALPMALAEELDADWRNVRATLAPAGDPYKDPGFGMQMTGGSTALNHSFQQYRELGARARAMLVAAAAQQWKVDAASCKVAQGVVTSGSHRATFGELAPAAMALPVPQQVTLKDPSQFTIVGKPTPRLDARGKMDATTPFGIDTHLKDMVVAVVARPPRFGGKVKSFSADKASAVQGVRGVLQVPVDRGGSGVAVIASGYWPAKMGRDALDIQWEDAGSKVSSQALFDEYAKLAGSPARCARGERGYRLGHQRCRAQDRGRLPLPVPGARADGAAELHAAAGSGRRQGAVGQGLGGLAVPDRRPGRGGAHAGAGAGQGGAQHHDGRRRLRPARGADLGLHRGGGQCTQGLGCRRPHRAAQGGLEPRG